MPLILAIEPDRRQASQLTAMVRNRLQAELVLGESAERALAALGQRVPDLILTSALLSPKDETALGERLRALDGAAAHVQTLTIPVLSSSSGRGVGRAGGVLFGLRREKWKADSSHGCDPSVFAEQCREYLERAATERALLADQAALTPQEKPAGLVKPARTDAPLVKSKVEALAEQAPAGSHVPPESQAPAEPVRAAYPLAPPEPLAPAVSVAAPAPVEPLVNPKAEHTAPDATEKSSGSRGRRPAHRWAPDEAEGPSSLVAAVAALEAEQDVQVEPLIVDTPFEEQSANAPEEMLVRANPFHASPSRANPFDPSPSAAHSYDPEPSDALQTESAEGDEIDLSSMLDDSDARTGGTAGTLRSAGFEDEPVEVYEIDTLVTEPADDPVTPAAAAATESTEPDDLRQWTDILEALRRDAEQAAAAPMAPEVTSPDPGLADVSFDDYRNVEATPASEAPPADESAGKKKKKRSRNGPAQDEWGFFDPNQCGFAALIEKLEEITDEDETPTPKPKRA